MAPKPLLLPDAKLAVVFAPRAACSTVVFWCLHHLGLAQEARAYATLPHKYRNQVYYKSPRYREALGQGDLPDHRIVRVMRDPYQRAVSSFRHALINGYANEDIAAALGHDPGTAGLSFAEFLSFLERLDLGTSNPHFRIQHHPLETALPVRHLINISKEDLFARLNAVEADVGLPRTDFAALDWIHAVEGGRKTPLRADASESFQERLSRSIAIEGPWPRPEALLVPEARERLARLYAVDLKAYGIS